MKKSYLSEREFTENPKCKIDEKKYEFWKRLLGEDILRISMKHNTNLNAYMKGKPYKVRKITSNNGLGNGGLIEYINMPLSGQENSPFKRRMEEKVFFTEFYEKILRYGKERLAELLQGKEKFYTEEIYQDYMLHLAEQLQAICLRTLIAELHNYRLKGYLQGQDSKKEYDYFCREVVCKPEFIETLFEKYPVLYRCMEERIECLSEYYAEVILHFQTERDQIRQILCEGKKTKKITRISGGFSDVHNRGRQVLKVRLDNGMELLYKPHSMENEQNYQSLLKWLEGKTGITQGYYGMLSYQDHSWSAIVEYKACTSQESIRRYYKRLGVQLFLAYFLGTKDLHCENVIASGEYPILVDLETFVNHPHNRSRTTAGEEIIYQLSRSVLCTGLLPVYSWNRSGNGVDGSGISGIEGQKYPFRVPRVVGGRTSEMHIEYAYPYSQNTQNLAAVQGQFYHPVLYEEEILDGYTSAYSQVISHKKEFKKMLRLLQGTRSRVLAADTQRYSMLLSSSYHPSLMMDGAEREIFLHSLWKGRGEDDRQIVESEIKSLLNGDIPYFYYCLDGRNLVTAQGEEMTGYFACSGMEMLYQRLDDLDEADLESQAEYIRISLELTSENQEKCMNRVYRAEESDQAVMTREDMESIAIRLTEKVLKHAVWNPVKTEVNWRIAHFSSEGSKTWNISPMGMYLYDGLAGMLLLMYALSDRAIQPEVGSAGCADECRLADRIRRTEVDFSGNVGGYHSYLVENAEKIRKIYTTLKHMLFQYTDRGMSSLGDLQSENTGAYNGESSILYVYLTLYRQSKEAEYLEYAGKHARIVEQLIEKDENYDLLSGNAGAAQVLLLAYQVTGNRGYLDMAERAFRVLEQKREKQEAGIGWITEKGTPPMAGMAHGNSGVLIPVIALWRETGIEKYKKLAEHIWAYEESLYRPQINNWADIRGKGSEQIPIDTVAWCHGAAGVLASRIYCYQVVEDSEWEERLKKDILRAYAKVREYWKRDSWCLCHGICGNVWIMEYLNETLGEEMEVKSKIRLVGDFKLLPQERMNPGMMSGYGGILYYFLNKEI
ncbi:type 2 lanthipeptide synthetase LanM family protein [Bariatricus sp. SGI.161]|uniref:type 2 lanthipeptide synthetase LanM family protein n=1 Tax=Bariatricus sp. SGI.161 TaxID=3420550 RepID=UPI003CFCC1A9